MGACPRCGSDINSYTMRCAACDFPCYPGAINYGTRPTPSPAYGSTNAAPGIGPGAVTKIGTLPAGTSLTVADIAAAKRALIAKAIAIQNNPYSSLNNMGVSGFAAGQMMQPHRFLGVDLAREPPKPLEAAGISVGEFVGWRIWGLSRGYLKSYSAKYAWLPGHPAQGGITDHGYGGIWAFKDPHRAFAKAHEGGGLYVAGSVWLWGEVIEHSDGHRGECAAIRSLDAIVVSDGPIGGSKWRQWQRRREKQLAADEMLAELRQRYGVGSAEDAEAQKKSAGPDEPEPAQEQT